MRVSHGYPECDDKTDISFSVISETQTRLDSNNQGLRQNDALTVRSGPLGSLSFTLSSPGEALAGADVEEDTKSNELCLLLGKIANYLASGDALNSADFALPRGQRPFVGVTHEKLLERWHVLISELQQWHDSLPHSFPPCATLDASGSHGISNIASLESFE